MIRAALRKMRTFQPAWWCRGPHAQSIFGGLFRPCSRLRLTRERLEMPDGDFLDIDFLENASSNTNQETPLVLILHGLEGSSEAACVQSLLREIQRRGWNGAAMNMRMCSGESNRLKQTYHSGKTEDLDFVVHDLIENKGCKMLHLVGFSIGGNIILKWLGERGDKASQEIQTAAAVSVPYDLVKSVELMDQGFNREVYTRALLRSLKSKVFAKEKRFPEAVSYPRVKRCRTFKEFDSWVTAPLNGFKDEMDYWIKSSCRSFLKSIRVPTLLIHAEDDPFFSGRLLPMNEIRGSDYLQTLFLPEGGHLGFVAGRWPWKRELWLENTLLDFFSETRCIRSESALPEVEPKTKSPCKSDHEG